MIAIMAQCFQVDSFWLQNKWPGCAEMVVVRDTASLLPLKKKTIQYSLLWKLGLNLRQQSLNSRHVRVLCSNSNTTRKQSSSTRRRRPSRASMSDEELRRDLQLFLGAEGLPIDKVPTTKELANLGRNDLARIVRRRGYKAINELLSDSDTELVIEHETETTSDLNGCQNGTSKDNNVENCQSHNADQLGNGAAAHSVQPGVSSDISQQQTSHQKSVDFVVSDSRPTLILNESSQELVSNHKAVDLIGSESGASPILNGSSQQQISNHKSIDLVGSDSGASYFLNGSSRKQTTNHTGFDFVGLNNASQFLNGTLFGGQADEHLQRKAAAFVRTGQLDHSIDSDDDEDSDVDEDKDDNSFDEYSSDDDDDGQIWDANMTPEEIAIQKATKLRAKLLPFLKKSITNELKDRSFDLQLDQDRTEEFEEFEGNTEGSFFTVDTENELRRVKTSLSSKERELEETLRELDETKAQLALIQAKAAAEVAKAKQVVLEKDIRLKSADQALANLKQVQVEYWGEGSIVELAGSFNGWKHFISMQPDLTSEIRKPDGSRGPLMWETELWLYPGIYEIKFIVDGQWVVDKRRDVVMNNSLHNNLLLVEP